MSRILALMRVLVRVQVAPPMRSSAGLALPGAAEALHQVHARQRDIELGAAGIFEQHVVALGLALGDLPQPQILRDAVLGVDDVIARLEIDQVGGESGQRGFRGRRAGHHFGGFEQILRPKNYKFRILKRGTVPDHALDQVNAGHGPGEIRALREVGGGGIELLQTELVWEPYSLRMSATRSTSPEEDAKNATRLPASTRLRASAMATCILPWKAMAGRVGMCRLAVVWNEPDSPSPSQPISNSFNEIWGIAPACRCSSSQRKKTFPGS